MTLKIVAFSCLFVFTAGDRVIPNLSRSVQNSSREGRIRGGSEAEPHEFPHMVTLDNGDHLCGGGILNENWVITAAHCLSYVFEGDTFRVKAGKHSLKTVEDTEQVINVAKTFAHESYPGGVVVAAHDIALLKLEKPLVFNKYVQPIALPPPIAEPQPMGQQKKYRETTGIVLFSGWGKMENNERPDKLRRAQFNVVDFDTCKKADESIWGPPSFVTDTMLCTGLSPDGVFACNLDSGSPLIKQDGRKTYLAGVFSWLSPPCGKEGAPSVFTKVSSYVDWINNIMSNN